MPRSKRYPIENGWYHVFNRGAGRRHIFVNDYLKNVFIKELAKAQKKYSLNIYAFCIMGNHYHLLLNTPEANLSQAMRYLNSRYSLRFNKFRGKDGPIFKGRFGSTFIAKNKYLSALSRYIHLNPVEAGVVQKPELYEWSSYIDYKRQESRFSWLKILDLNQTESKTNISKYTQKGNSKKLLDFYAKNKISSILK